MKRRISFLALMYSCAMLAAVPEFLVTGAKPSRLEKIAEEELQCFYQQIYGKPLKKIAESQAKGKKAIYLGKTQFASGNGVNAEKAGKEEWILKTVGADLIISGGNPAGTLYGVYAVLERLGVGFLAPDETVIPKNKPDFPKFNEKKRPAMEGRLIYDGICNHLRRTAAPKPVIDAYLKWILRNRINGQAIPAIKPIYVGGLYNIPHYPYHNLCDYVPRSLYKTHPEYFQMDEQGRRLLPKNDHMHGCICMSNPDVRRITLESLRKRIQNDRKKFAKEDWPYVYDISTLDASPYICKCPKCKAISAIDGSETGLLLDYINHVAREIRKEYPEIIIRTFGYSASRNPPKKIMPEKNVLIQLTDSFSSRDPFRSTESTLDSWFRNYYNGWFKAAPQLMVWDYWNLGGTYFTPPRVETVFDALQPDIRFFARNKVKAMFYEASMDDCSPQNFMMLNYYVTNHLMVDLNVNVEKLADEFIRGYFGPAAPMMKRYFTAIRDGIRRQPQKANTIVVAHWNYLTPKFMLQLYKDFHAAADKLPVNSKYAKRIRHELVSPVWYTLANWGSYEKAFTAAGITKKQLIAECRKLAYEFIARNQGTNQKRSQKYFEERFAPIELNLPRPEKFKNVPEKNFRMITYMNFNNVGIYNSKIVADPESIQGKALKSADPRPERHGINKLLDARNHFYTTQFTLGNHRAPGRVTVHLRSVAQDEKYHWYRIPGSLELRPISYFSAQGWAIQAPTKHWYTLTDGNPLDNTWDQVWFNAKFTGPAYVPGSKKENAIYVDMVVITRGEKDPLFVNAPEYVISGRSKDGKLPANWSVNAYYKNTGRTEVFRKGSTDAIRVFASSKAPTAVQGPIINCKPGDVVRVRVRSNGPKCEIGLYYFKQQGFNASAFQRAPDTGRQNEYIFYVDDVKKPGTARCRLVLYVPAGKNTYEFDQIDVSIIKALNQFEVKK